MELKYIRESRRDDKKYVAGFMVDGKEKRIRFGAKPYKDFTIGATNEQRDAYRKRHKGDNLDTPLSAGALSYYILWGKSRDLKANIKSFKKRFNV